MVQKLLELNHGKGVKIEVKDGSGFLTFIIFNFFLKVTH
jgi:hypothetical protein